MGDCREHHQHDVPAVDLSIADVAPVVIERLFDSVDREHYSQGEEGAPPGDRGEAGDSLGDKGRKGKRGV